MNLDTGALLHIKDVSPIAFNENPTFIESITGIMGLQYSNSGVSTERFLIPAIFKYGIDGDVKFTGSLILQV